MRLILVRHGETYGNAAHSLDTKFPGAALTERGWQQANDIVNTLVDSDIDAIWVSNLQRTTQTATPLATRLSLELNMHEGLREIAAGELEGQSSDEAYEDYLSTVVAWLRGDLDRKMGGPDGVTGHECLERFDEAIAEIEATGVKTAAVFSHGSMITFWTGMRGKGITEDHLRTRILNTGMSILDGNLNDGYRCVSWMNQGVSEL